MFILVGVKTSIWIRMVNIKILLYKIRLMFNFSETKMSILMDVKILFLENQLNREELT